MQMSNNLGKSCQLSPSHPVRIFVSITSQSLQDLDNKARVAWSRERILSDDTTKIFPIYCIEHDDSYCLHYDLQIFSLEE